jgi:hypothetical protein
MSKHFKTRISGPLWGITIDANYYSFRKQQRQMLIIVEVIAQYFCDIKPYTFQIQYLRVKFK